MDSSNNKMAPENQLIEDINSHDAVNFLNNCNLKTEPMMDLFQPQLENSANIVEPSKDAGFAKIMEGDVVEQPLDAINKMEVFEEDPSLNSAFPLDAAKRKRRSESQTEENSESKKSSLNSTSDEKKIINLRKNIRDVMDENQLDTDTLAAQREESERLARVAEQQKIIREYQRQTAVNRQFVRTQNRVLSLLKSGNTYAKPAELSESKAFAHMSSEECELSENKDIPISMSVSADEKLSSESLSSSADIDIKPLPEPSTPTSTVTSPVSEQLPSDVVTIEDSSSEDDCIMLSDDEEDDLEEEPEDDPNNSGLHVKDVYNVPDEHGRVVVNVGHPEGEEDIFIAPQISKTIKPHQIGGVRFLFDNVIESTKRFKHSSGFGCILAHSMGLGKTLQVICFCDIFLRHTPSKSVLCVMPINTLQNWVSEFNMWTPRESSDHERIRPREFDVYVLNDQHKTLSARAKVVLKWAEQGGVLLIGYELFRLLALKLLPTRRRRGKNINAQNAASEANARLMESMHQALVKPGPDLVICDEGHRIKNAHAGISLALKQIRTRRRIVLTGYPLQNNLLEYWCMVDFVRPNYLGTRTEFCNMFERPIQNGQCIDSTPEDIKLMRYRAHVLHSLLVGFVQRRSHVVLQQTLPVKLEYVILTRMTSFQRQLYQTFMNDVVRSKAVPNPLKAFAVCCKIWNHPDVLYNFLKKRETDLDLEIDDSEVASEQVLPIVPTDITSDSKSKATSLLGSNVAPPVAVKLECDLSQSQKSVPPIAPATESSAVSSAKLGSESNMANNQLDVQNVSANLNANPNQSYNNMYYPSNYYQQNSDLTYTPECDGNSYWQEPNAPYFFYHSLPSSVGFPVKPDYVGLMDKDAGAKSASESGNVTSSSEIVDLDTKEIKTIETDIDMSRNPIMKNNAAQEVEKSNDKETALDKDVALEKDTADTKDAMDATKNVADTKQNSTSPVAGIEKEPPQKVKSDDGIPYEWGIELMKKYEPGLITSSPKMEIFFCILNESINLGDRVLLFSQSLLTLNLIESFLQSNTVPGYNAYWTRNISYFRLDGSTTSQEREKLVNEFNSNHNVKLFLISTRAGSLGINLVGANRVIVFDASWNPCHDTQAVYRIYRYGQKKACYVYRIVMDKCLEKKIYDRQIKKQGMSDRVVDECNPDAHLSMKDVTNLCHDYDDDDVDEKSKRTSPSFSQPLESFGDVIVQKIIEQYKNCLSKEPFHHESLLIDRKEKKLSQAEKRQAHRGYEMEKKASIKQTSIGSINKIQYRIVRNDGTVVNRPVASIRPMQTTRTQNANKSGGIRSTRWIPAEVWQRQGMTAQEMTLPLDVVIPTNSNDKSNIVLRAGQRVMVLKSAKGIYMQLDSGKIIAIRTSNKATEESKLEKGEVIDITSEGDAATEEKSDAGKSATSTTKTSPSTNSGSKSQCNDNTNASYKTNSSQAACETSNVSSINKNKNAYRRNSNAQADNFEEKDNFPKQTKELKVQKVESISNDTFAEMKRDTLSVHTNKQMATLPFSSKPYAKPVVGSFSKGSKGSKLQAPHKMSDAPLVTQQEILKTSSTPSEQTASQQHTLLPSTPEGIKKPTHFLPHEKDIDINKPVFKAPNNNAINPNNQFTAATLLSKDDADIKSDIRAPKPGPYMPMQQEKRISQPTDLFGAKSQEAAIANTRMNDAKPNFFAQPLKSKQLGNVTAKPSKCSYPNLQKAEVKNASESFSKGFIDRCEINNESKPQTSVSSASAAEYLPAQCQVSKYGQAANRAEAAPLAQQPLPQQQQQQQPHPKLHMHVPHYNMQHTQFSNSVAPLHMGVAQAQCLNPDTNLASNTFFPSREVNPGYPSHYDNIYNSNNMGAPCEYPAQYSDYSAYGSYSHPQYHSQLHTNSYGSASSAALSANPYNLHWSPLVTPTPLSEQYNAMYPATFTQNGAQSNQWCNP